MVEPTKLKPRFFKSLLMASDSGVLAGTPCPAFQEFIFGLPPVNCQMYLSKEPNSFWTARKALAFCVADLIFSLLRILPGFFSRTLCFLVSYFATFFGSKLLKAFL